MTAWKNLGSLIDRSGDLDRTAIIDLRDPAVPRTWTHREIDELADGVAVFLREKGLAGGASVAIVSLNRAEYIATYFGIMRAGFVAVPVNVKLPKETIDFIAADAALAFAFVDAAGRKLLDPTIPFLGYDEAGPTGFTATVRPAHIEPVEAGPTDIAQMLYTSGSTGRPKGVPLTHAGQLWALSHKTQAGSAGADERYIIAQPLFHMNGLFSMKTIFAGNASLVLMPGFDTRRYIEAMAAYGVTALMGVPTMFARVVKEHDLIASRRFALRRIGLGSAPITTALVDRIAGMFPGAPIVHGYGTTEAGPAVFGPHPDGLPPPPLALGTPIPGSEVKLVDGPSVDEGVLVMRNPAVMSGYRNLPEQSRKVLDQGWYYSGDVMRRDADGFYYFVGRADDMFVCSGENIYPGEVEKMLEAHPQVVQAAVVPLPDEERGQVPVAFLVLREGTSLAYEDIKRFSLQRAPAYQHPRRVAIVPQLPWAGTNKIDRKALIEEARRREPERGWSA